MTDLRGMVGLANREVEERAAQTKAQQLHLEYVNLVDYPFTPSLLHLIPADQAQRLLAIAYLKNGTLVKVATPQPENPELQQALTELSSSQGWQLELAACSVTSIRYALRLSDVHEPPPTATERVGQHKTVIAPAAFADQATLAKRLTTVSTTEALDVLFAGALAARSSDIHIEPTEQGVTIRFRVDGVLQTIVEAPLTLYRSLRSRIKYLAELKLDVVDKPQDGRFEFQSLERKLDVRVSALPTPFGESFVLRLLSGGSQLITLPELGFSQQQIETIRTAMGRPNGLILNTGPTGSGKTTTLYAILNELNRPGVKIITVEDPIEYRLKGIQQSQVEPDKGYTFATALRSVLRQDPDIIMVGEIRDPDTALIAVQAALTGHLVLSTLHTNSAAGAIPRLLDMGVKTYLLSGVINLIIAQRLVRKVTPQASGQTSKSYEGRIAIAELLVPDPAIETLIQQKGSIDQFEAAAEQAGMVPLYQDGLNKVKLGLTTETEVKRVAAEE